MGLNSPLPVSLQQECKKCAKIIRSFVDSSNNGLDKVIPRQILSSAAGFAVFTVVKAGFLFSARAGSGLVIAKLDDGTWSAPSAIGLGGFGFGGQLGAEVTDFLIVLNSKTAVRTFMAAGSMTLGGNLSVAVGPLGRNAEGSGSLSSKGKTAALYSYSKTKGLFGGVSVEGSIIVERQDANRLAYNSAVSSKQLLSGHVDRPYWADSLAEVLDQCTGLPGGRRWIEDSPDGLARDGDRDRERDRDNGYDDNDGDSWTERDRKDPLDLNNDGENGYSGLNNNNNQNNYNDLGYSNKFGGDDLGIPSPSSPKPKRGHNPRTNSGDYAFGAGLGGSFSSSSPTYESSTSKGRSRSSTLQSVFKLDLKGRESPSGGSSPKKGRSRANTVNSLRDGGGATPTKELPASPGGGGIFGGLGRKKQSRLGNESPWNEDEDRDRDRDGNGREFKGDGYMKSTGDFDFGAEERSSMESNPFDAPEEKMKLGSESRSRSNTTGSKPTTEDYFKTITSPWNDKPASPKPTFGVSSTSGSGSTSSPSNKFGHRSSPSNGSQGSFPVKFKSDFASVHGSDPFGFDTIDIPPPTAERERARLTKEREKIAADEQDLLGTWSTSKETGGLTTSFGKMKTWGKGGFDDSEEEGNDGRDYTPKETSYSGGNNKRFSSPATARKNGTSSPSSRGVVEGFGNAIPDDDRPFASYAPKRPEPIPHMSFKKELTQGLEDGLTRVVALHDFEATQSGDLAFKNGDVIIVEKGGKGKDEWWTGRHSVTGAKGIFPANHVEVFKLR